MLLGHSFGGLVLENTISHSILDASSTGTRNTSPWDIAVAFNAADSSIGSRQLMSELDYLYRYDPERHAYVGRSPGAEAGSVVPENRLVNYHVVLQGETAAPSGVRVTENRAFEANIKENHPDYSFYTSEHNDGHEDRFCRNGEYSPDEVRPPTGREIWRRWKFVFTGNDRAPFWIVRVPKEIIWGHGGLWSDNSAAMLGALFRIQFPLTAGGTVAPPQPRLAPRAPDVQQLNQDKPR